MGVKRGVESYRSGKAGLQQGRDFNLACLHFTSMATNERVAGRVRLVSEHAKDVHDGDVGATHGRHDARSCRRHTLPCLGSSRLVPSLLPT